MLSKDAILPVSYFPSVSYLTVINQFNTSIELYENYQRRSQRNKCLIMSANGISELIIPLRKGKTKLNVKDVKIAYDDDWITNHLRTIRSAYGTAAYFDYYYEEIENLISTRHEYLMQLSVTILDFLKNKGIIQPYHTTKEYLETSEFKGFDGRPIKRTEAQEYAMYHQVFEHKYGFVSNLSILDTLFNTGPECRLIIDKTVLL